MRPKIFVVYDHFIPHDYSGYETMATRRSNSNLSRAAYLTCIFLLFNSNVNAFQGRPAVGFHIEHSPISSNKRPSFARSTLFQSQGVEEDFLAYNESPTDTSQRRWLSRRHWTQALRVDRKQVAELGMSFMLTYNLVSNINGSVFLSLAWYISSIRSGLSPLAPGQWKGLLGTYAGLYVFITLFRPIRLALAVALTKRVALVLEQTQDRFNCTKAMAAGIVLCAMLSFWMGFASLGITLASTLAGVPIWKGF